MIRAIILDDEAHIRDDLQEMILEHYNGEVAMVATADTVEKGLLAIQKFKPNLLLLDINFPDGTGFDILSKSTFSDFYVIFITAFDHHAIRAIKAGALDYLVKPFEKEEFLKAMDKAIQIRKKQAMHSEQLKIANEYYLGTSKKRIIVNTTEEIRSIKEDDILYCESDGNYTAIHLIDTEKIIVSKYIKIVEEWLPEESFIRCHRSYIVNTKHIVKYNKRGFFVLPENTKIPVSRERKEYVLKKVFS